MEVIIVTAFKTHRKCVRRDCTGTQSRQLRRLWCQKQGPGWHQSFTHIEHRADVTVIWASTRFGLPHSQTPSDMGIPSDPSPNLNPNHEGFFFFATFFIELKTSFTMLLKNKH